jgi:hypothetical protein
VVCSFRGFRLKFYPFDIAQGYGLESWGSVLGRGKFSPLHSVQSSPDDHSASYLLGTSVFLLGAKLPGRGADKSPPSNTEIEDCGVLPPLLYTSSCAWCLIN